MCLSRWSYKSVSAVMLLYDERPLDVKFLRQVVQYLSPLSFQSAAAHPEVLVAGVPLLATHDSPCLTRKGSGYTLQRPTAPTWMDLHAEKVAWGDKTFQASSQYNRQVLGQPKCKTFWKMAHVTLVTRKKYDTNWFVTMIMYFCCFHQDTIKNLNFKINFARVEGEFSHLLFLITQECMYSDQ